MSSSAMRPRQRLVSRVAVVVTAALLLLMLTASFAFAVPIDWYDGHLVPTDSFEVDNTLATAKPIVVGAPPQQHTIHAVLNSDWVKFQAKAGSTYVIENPSSIGAASLSGIDWNISGMRVVLELVDGSGAVLARSQGADYKRFTSAKYRMMNEHLVWKAPKAQMVYVRVSSFPDTYEPQMGAYLLQVRSVVPQITGKVTLPDGTPAEGAYVSAHPAGYGIGAAETDSAPDWSAAEALTDEHGNYTLYGLDDGKFMVHFDGVWWDGAYLQDEIYKNVHPSDETTPTEITVGGMKQNTGINAQLNVAPAFIKGRVVDQNGKGIEGILVRPYIYSGWYWYQPSSDYYAETDADGYYECRNGSDGTWRIGFDSNTETAKNRYPIEYWNDALTVEAGNDITVVDGVAAGSYDATLVAYPTLATGVVKDTAGKPAAAISVQAYSPTGGLLFVTETDENGAWQFTTPDTYTQAKFVFADFAEARFATEWYNDKPDLSTATTVTLNPLAPPKLTTVLADMKPTVSGVVTDSKTGGKVAGAQVWLYEYTGTSWRPIDAETTDAKGAYTFQRVWGREFIVKFYDGTGFYAPEYYDNATSPFKARRFELDDGANMKVNASLQPQGDRIYGANRFSTAVAAAKQAFPDWAGVHDVIIASGDDAAAADPLAAASLSWAYDAPLLLTKNTETPAETLAALKQIEAASGHVLKIHVVGGPGSVPAARLSEMAAVVGSADVERLPFGDRYETARQIALRVHTVALNRDKDMGMVFVANGSDNGKFFDALSASAISAATGAPILLTTTGEVPSATKLALKELGAKSVYVVGGVGSVPDAALAELGATKRLAGHDRYDTSVMLAKFGGDMGCLSFTQVGLAAAMPDGATGGAAMGLLGGPMLITRSDFLPDATYKFIDDNDQFIEHAVIFGGPGSVSAAVTESVKQALKQ